jgi:polysaccharide export outer membrane protein
MSGRGRLAETAWRCGVGLALVAGVAACASRKPLPPPPETGPVSQVGGEYVIGPSDLLRIQVWKNPELSAEVPVRPDGKISVPLLDDLQAAGLTTRELKEILAQAFAEYVTAPDVTVIVTDVRSKVVYVVGAVNRPSAVPLNLDMRALDAIAIVGGFSPYADKSDIKILRPGPDGSVTEYRFDYKAFLRGRNLESNLRLQPGDTIVVPD